jgi:hypothetical protein
VFFGMLHAGGYNIFFMSLCHLPTPATGATKKNYSHRIGNCHHRDDTNEYRVLEISCKMRILQCECPTIV